MKLTDHAVARMQQRGIPPLVVDLLQTFGRTRYQNGSTVLYFDNKARQRAQLALKDALQNFDKLGNAYLIEANDSGAVITVGHRHERIRGK